jgi:flavin-dependent dehydrogenase
VLLLEKDRFPRQKVCGEFVSAESLKLLGELLGQAQLSSYPLVSAARFFLDSKCVRLPLTPAARSIPRYAMDAELFAAAAKAGVATFEETAVVRVARQEMFMVETEQQSFSAKALVNATGRWSKLTQFNVAGKQKWLGLKAHFTEPQPPSSVDLYFFPGGYCGVTPVDNNTVNACAMVRADVARALDEVFAREPELERRSRAWRPLYPVVTTSPLYFREPQTESDGMLLTGDAAGFIDPFAGDGISLALQSGRLAAQALLPFLQEKCTLESAQAQYREAYKRRFAPAFRNAARLRNAFAAPRWVRRAALTLASMPVVGSMLVRRTRAKITN